MSSIDRLCEVTRLQPPNGGRLGAAVSSSYASTAAAAAAAVSRDSVATGPLEDASLEVGGGPAVVGAPNPLLLPFFESVAEVKALLEQIRRQLQSHGGRSLRELFEELHQTVDRQQVDALTAQIELTTQSITRLVRECQDRLGEVQRETEAREGVLPEGYSGSEIRMRRNISVALSQQASGLLSEFLQMQGAHQEWHRGEVTRCVRFFFGASLDIGILRDVAARAHPCGGVYGAAATGGRWLVGPLCPAHAQPPTHIDT
jgi:hypothetical protein